MCVISSGDVVVDASCGSMGVVDARPVRNETLFEVFQLSGGLLSLLVMQQIHSGALSIDESVASAWPKFGTNGKEKITLKQLLHHRSGLASAVPKKKTLRELCDWQAMVDAIANGERARANTGARNGSASAGETETNVHAYARTHGGDKRGGSGDDCGGSADDAVGEYEGGAWGWAVSGLLAYGSRSDGSRRHGGGTGGDGGNSGSGGGHRLSSLLRRRLASPLGCSSELHFGVTDWAYPDG
eukprot:4805591-Pleurochrysis_carterae.AAC.1